MKFIKSYKIFESIDLELGNELSKFNITKYNLNEDGSIDCNQNVSIYNKNLNKIPFKFNKIDGIFTIVRNNIKSLKNCPVYVSIHFSCIENQLTNLEYGPEYVGENYNCSYNQLVTLKGCVEEVYLHLKCKYNKLTSLEFCPMEVEGDFDCSNNQLEFLDRSPLIKGDLSCQGMFKSKPEFNGHCENLYWR